MEKLISKIIDIAANRIGEDTDKYYVSVGMYNCVGSWQTWLNFGESGVLETPSSVIIDGESFVEDKTLNKSLLKLKKAISNNKSEVIIRKYYESKKSRTVYSEEYGVK